MLNVQLGPAQLSDMNFNFSLTDEEANVILSALGELPAKVAIPIINKLHEQARFQIDAAEVTTEAE